MLIALRHLLAILILPFMVVVVVPYALLGGFAAVDSRWGLAPLAGLPRVLGAALAVLGLALFAWCVSLFARVGRGTLAPWDPPRSMVAVGPYRFVRNPMILSVGLLLLGHAAWRGSWVLGVWAAAFLVLNHLLFVFFEEPGLEQRFGEPYRAYKDKVPRWLPRLKGRR
jgi:protein-S-isoprenylcysteine O-methyltransferase Ste14